MSEVGYGILILQDAPFDELERRWQRAEEIGFDQIYVADHACDYRNLTGPWFDGWTVLAAMARTTMRARIGTLVSNPILRSPSLVAKAAATIDHLSGGRLELGIGTGIAGFDHAAAGEPYWSPKERAARFKEYVRIVDGLLRSSGEPFSFHGRHYMTHETSFFPAAQQRPRPPLTIGGQSPTALEVAAERGDRWNTHGPFGQGYSEILEITRRQNRWLDSRCEELGRDPSSLRRSLSLFGPLDAWSSPDALERTVADFLDAGITEFVVFWPDHPQAVEIFDSSAERFLRHPGARSGAAQ